MGNFGKAWSLENLSDKQKEMIQREQKQMADILVKIEEPVKENRRVHGAKKVEGPDGSKYDSKLEFFMDNLLKVGKFNYIRQYPLSLQEKFNDPFTGKTIQGIHWVVDFYFPDIDWIVDTKGYPTEVFTLKYKLFLYKFSLGHYDLKSVRFAKNQKECLQLFEELKTATNAVQNLRNID